MFPLPELPYGYGDLAPVVSETTMRTHYDKHHARYVQVTNELLAQTSGAPATLEEVILDARRREARKLFNNAAQAWNHGFFWVSMSPRRSKPAGDLAAAVAASFGDLAGLQKAFTEEGAGHFGSGWVWLVGQGDKLSVMSTHDAATPLTDADVTPLLVCDVWEHAYYLDHKNDRAGFLAAWWDQLVDWEFVGRQFAAAQRGAPGWAYPRPKVTA